MQKYQPIIVNNIYAIVLFIMLLPSSNGKWLVPLIGTVASLISLSIWEIKKG